MNWELVGAFLAILAGGAAVIGPVIKWLVNDWFEKSKKIEQLKEAKARSVLADLKTEIESHNSQLISMKAKMEGYNQEMIRTQSQVSHIAHNLETTLKTAEFVSRNLDQNVQKHVKSEIKQLTQHLMMIKNAGGTRGK